MGNRVAEVHQPHEGPLHDPHRERRVGGEPADELLRLLLEVPGLGDPGDHPEFVHAARRQRVAEKEHLAGRHRTALLDDLLREEPVRSESDLGEGHAEPGPGARDREVAVERNLVAARDGVPLHHRDDGEREVLEGAERSHDRGRAPEVLGALAEVHAGAEHGARGPQHRHPLLRPRIGGERRLQLVQHLDVERVALLRTVEGDGADRPRAFDEHFRHRRTPLAGEARVRRGISESGRGFTLCIPPSRRSPKSRSDPESLARRATRDRAAGRSRAASRRCREEGGCRRGPARPGSGSPAPRA